MGPGRGSGAGSVVAWALTITDLDPIALDLLFERFLNPERVSMPDFDIDFCETHRDKVIAYVQGKYGRDKVAQIITFGRLKARAVLKDTGRVLQMSYGHVDRLAKLIPNHPTDPWTLERSLNGVPEVAAEYKDPDVKRLFDLAMKLEGLPRHASTHAAGVVIGDRPLDELVPLYRDPRSDMPVTQFDMKYVEAAGLVKFDFLGLKTLSVLKEGRRLLAEQGVEVDLEKLPWDDEAVYELIQRGDAVGVFQLESEGMRRTLAAIRPTSFGDIIALVALYRPGPMDNIPMFGDRKNGRATIEYPHPLLERILAETYGIFVYQEQVMQAAQVLAGYSLGEADLLRRAMGKKIKSEMDAQRARFVEGCAAHNQIPAAKANELFDTIDKFAGYGFNKSHAAAYALVAYQTAWLKAHHRAEFYAASMSFDMALTDKLGDFRRGHAPRRGRVPAAGHQRQPRLLHRREWPEEIAFAMRSARSRAWARRRWRPWSKSGSGQGRSPALKTSLRGSTRACSTAVSSKASPPRARSTASSPSGPQSSPLLKLSSPMPPAPSTSGKAGRPACLAEAPPKPRRSGCRATCHGRSPSAWPPSAMPSASISPPTQWTPRATCSRRTRSGPLRRSSRPKSPRANASDRPWLALVEEARWRTSAKGRRYMMATLSDSSGQFMATAFDDEATAALEAAAKAGHCGLLSVELDRRAGDEMPRVTIKRFRQLADLAKSTRLQMTIRLADVATAAAIARELAGARGSNGLVRFIVSITSGGKAVVIAGRDYALDAELAARIERVTGEGSVGLSVQEPPKLALVG